ncbi:hypothetical protein [Desulfonatronovibrio magnus]|uniref:hypothetical protein n=1 Tax=Desulfonatronovibrio magnus TaxID=698827 RepID=UPI0005EBEB30|nr:hypothetical protein [Desulfonatronovibrio magnus]
MSQPPECIDCTHCLPDGQGPTHMGICLLDPEFEPYLDEILEFNFENCHSLIKKKSFDFKCEGCPDFSPIEAIDIAEFDNSVFDSEPSNFNSLFVDENQIIHDIQQIDFENMPVERYLQDLYSSSSAKREKAIGTLGALTMQRNKKAGEALVNLLNEQGPPKTLKQAKFKVEILRHFRSQENNQELLEILLSDLENTVSNNTTRQWISAILDFLRLAPLEMIDDRLQSMVDRNVFSYRLKKRVMEILDPEPSFLDDPFF